MSLDTVQSVARGAGSYLALADIPLTAVGIIQSGKILVKGNKEKKIDASLNLVDHVADLGSHVINVSGILAREGVVLADSIGFVTPLGIATTVLSVGAIAKSVYHLSNAVIFQKGLKKSDTAELVEATHSTRIKRVFGVSQKKILKALDEGKGETAIKNKVKQKIISESLRIVIKTIKLIAAIVFAFGGPLGMVIGSVGLGIATACSYGLMAYDSYSLRKFKKELQKT